MIERNNKTRTIFDKKQKVIAVYKDVRKRLNEIIQKNSEALKDYKIDVDAFLSTKSDFFGAFS